MKSRLLIIDPQNDFCDIPGAALPVSGAAGDMTRLAHFIKAAESAIEDIVITLDTHSTIGIERPAFWKTKSGAEVKPFTTITEESVLRGVFIPRDGSLLGEVLTYLHTLEASQKYSLLVWPAHCVLGTWGHNINETLANAVSTWESAHVSNAYKVLKGLNPLTEQYSAVKAEVPRSDDHHTQLNQKLVTRVLAPTELLLVAGEASSHCVAATMRDLFASMTEEQLNRTVLLSDCMHPVTGFKSQQAAFFAEAKKLGVRVLPSPLVLSLLYDNAF